MPNVIRGYRVPDVPGICWTCSRIRGDLSQVLIFPHELQETLSATEKRFEGVHLDPLGRVISTLPSVPARLFFATGICMQCTYGWIDHLDREFVGVYPSVATGSLDGPAQATLAWWFARTAVLLNTSTNYRVLVPASERWALSEGPPPGFSVHLAQMPDQPEPLEYAQGAPGVVRDPGSMSTGELTYRIQRMFACSIRVGSLVAIVSYAPPDRWAHPAKQLSEIFPTPNGTIATKDLPVLSHLLQGMVLTNV